MLLENFENYVHEQTLCSKEDKVLLAVSGGVDSMVMLSLFAQAGYNIGVAHCNFQLRGAESEEDEMLVEMEAKRYDVPFYNQRFDTVSEIENSGESTQMVARRLRYEWFDSLCGEHEFTHIAIAHHADDSVETFFINLLRGTGLRGLTGINVINGRLIRPLLFSPRKEIIDFAISHKVQYREDSSNASTKYLRNKIRLGIVPRIKEVSPQFTDTMTSNVERLTAAQSFIDREISLLRELVITHDDDRSIIHIDAIDPQLPMKFVIFEMMNRFGFHGNTIEDICRAMESKSTGRRFYAKEKVAYLDRNSIIITPIADEDNCALEVTDQSRIVCCGGGVLMFERLAIDDVDQLIQPDHVAMLDELKLTYPLVLRRWADGDSFIPFGMHGHKKVSDLLVDNKVSMPDKKRQFVLTSGSDIVWVVGRRIDERYRVDSSTENVLKIVRSLE